MKKINISEVDINASTLNSLPPGYYDFRSFGLGTNVSSVTPTINDFNEDLETGFYQPIGSALNRPSAVPPGSVLLHVDRTTGYCIQLLLLGNGQGIAVRTKVAGTWGEWNTITAI